MILDSEVGRVYARALVAIARADHELVPDEILCLRDLMSKRLGDPIEDAVLFDVDQTIDELVAATQGAPFRSAALAPRDLGQLLLTDGLTLALADGHACHEEITTIDAFAAALGCTDDDRRELRARLLALDS